MMNRQDDPSASDSTSNHPFCVVRQLQILYPINTVDLLLLFINAEISKKKSKEKNNVSKTT